MAGHNKWSKVKHKKGVADAKRSKVWTKIIREISVAVRLGSDDPGSNPRLRKALDDARDENIPKDTLQRAISRASSGPDAANYEEITYEGYGPGGVAMLVECMTDNRNRTIGDVRAIFTKNGGNLGSSGAVSFMFKKKGQLSFDKKPEKGKAPTEDMLLEVGLDRGAEDVTDEGDSFLVACAPEDFVTLREAYEKAGLVPSLAEVAMVADNTTRVAGENAQTLLKMIDLLEDLDDVQHVFSNMEIDEKEMERLVAA